MLVQKHPSDCTVVSPALSICLGNCRSVLCDCTALHPYCSVLLLYVNSDSVHLLYQQWLSEIFGGRVGRSTRILFQVQWDKVQWDMVKAWERKLRCLKFRIRNKRAPPIYCTEKAVWFPAVRLSQWCHCAQPPRWWPDQLQFSQRSALLVVETADLMEKQQ